MTNTLANWETSFGMALQCIDIVERQKAGTLLSTIPNHVNWDDFLATVKAEWQTWRGNLGRYPNCLVVLYGGLAFYEYDENTLWPQFARAIGSERLPTSQQDQINTAFSKVAKSLGLKIHHRDSITYYVGSAVYHIGIPLSLWDGFLEICEWAQCRNDLNQMSDKEWAESVGKRAGGRQRLKKFLIDNREAASAFIQEMLDAREILTKDASLTVDDIAQASLLRIEYFDEVPETADFFRPQNPESLFRDRARIIWDTQRNRISLQLPAVAKDKLPATWSIEKLTQKAAATPDELILNSSAFDTSLLLMLKSGQQSETQRLRGIKPLGLFDLEKSMLVNPDRQQLPIRSYALISPEKLDGISRKGFEEEENPANEIYELEDGATCYVTCLWPRGKTAELSFTQGGVVKKLNFRSSLKIESRFFVGEGSHAANFTRFKDWIKIERLPLLCVAIPFGYFPNTESVLQSKFQVNVGEKQTYGKWEKRHQDEDREFYFWCWADELQPRKKIVISIKAPELGVRFEYAIEMLIPKLGIDECWRNLPGAFLPWFLLVQSAEGMEWDDLMLAKDAIAPQRPISSQYLLRKYANHGLLRQQGRTWMISESRAVLESSAIGECHMQFCGDPSVLWGLFRHMRDHTPQLPVIEVVDKRGEMPSLLMKWEQNQKDRLIKYLERHSVRIVSNLWRY